MSLNPVEVSEVKGQRDSQCKLVPLLADLVDVVLQVVEEQLHHVQLFLCPPDGNGKEKGGGVRGDKGDTRCLSIISLFLSAKTSHRASG